MEQTPKGMRLHIGIFGRRNAGKSSIINALTYQHVSIVSEIPGTTTDPVEKTMELLPLGPVVFIDTAGLDDEGELGEKRMERSIRVINRTELAIIVSDSQTWGELEDSLVLKFRQLKTPLIVAFNKTDLRHPSGQIIDKLATQNIRHVMVTANKPGGAAALRNAIIESVPDKFIDQPRIIADLVDKDDVVVLVIPIDKEAPKGRIILPQVQTLRELLDIGAMSVVTRETELADTLKKLVTPPKLVVTDSQAFSFVNKVVPRNVMLTSFSILFARFKGDFRVMLEGARSMKTLKPGDSILVAEACAHHPIGEDIGRIKIPKWLDAYVGGNLSYEFTQGHDFPANLNDYKLVIQCGSCVFNRQAIISRIMQCSDAGVPITNYGLAIAFLTGILDRSVEIMSRR